MDSRPEIPIHNGWSTFPHITGKKTKSHRSWSFVFKSAELKDVQNTYNFAFTVQGQQQQQQQTHGGGFVQHWNYTMILGLINLGWTQLLGLVFYMVLGLPSLRKTYMLRSVAIG